MFALALLPRAHSRVQPMSDATDRLLEDFLRTQKREERARHEEAESVKQAVTKSSDKIYTSMQQLSIDMGNKLEDFAKEFRGELKKTNSRVEEPAIIAKGAHTRLDGMQSKQETVHTARSMIYEMGTESPTGSWKISKETLDQYELTKEANTWRWIKSNGTKIGVTIISTLVAAILIAKFLGAAGIHIL